MANLLLERKKALRDVFRNPINSGDVYFIINRDVVHPDAIELYKLMHDIVKLKKVSIRVKN